MSHIEKVAKKLVVCGGVRRKVFAASVSTAALIGAASAQTESNEVDDRIVVVGSAIGVGAMEIESQALPIQVIGTEEIVQSGQFSVQELLRTEPAFIGAAGQDFETGDGRQTLNLRGIGDEYTLTLLNGQRFSVNGAANVAIIPPLALDRVEVLKAGASSLYGSDAVAGAVNLVLKNSYDGVGFQATYGDAEGGYNFQEYSFYFGGESDRTSFFALANFRTNDELDGTERAVTASNDRRPLGGFDGRSGFQVPGRVFLGDGSQVILNTDEFGRGDIPDGPEDFRPWNFDRDAHDRVPFGANQAYAATDVYTGLINAEHQLTDRTTITGMLLYNRLNQLDGAGASTGRLAVPASNPWNVFGEDVNVNYRFFHPDFPDDGFPIDVTNQTVTGQLAAKHQISDAFEGVLTFSAYREDFETEFPVMIEPLFIQQVNLTTPNAFNPFCDRCNTAEQFGGAASFDNFQQASTLFNVDARVNGEIRDLLPMGSIQTSVGGQWRSERVEVNNPALEEAGLLFDFGQNPDQSLEREVWALFGEARIPVLPETDGLGTSPLEIAVAARYERFSDFGGTFDPLVSLRGELIPDNLTLRASWNQSFRAPSLEQVIDASDPSDGLLFDPVAGERVEAIVFTGGNPDLDPETATTISGGLVWTPEAAPGLFLSLDYWRINQENIIVAPDAEAVVRGEQPGTVQRGNNIGIGGEDLLVFARLANFAQRRTSGFDFLGRYSTEVNNIELSADFAASYLLDFKVDALDGRGLVDGAGEFVPGFGTIPEFKFSSGLQATTADVTGRVEFTYTSSVEDFVNVPGEFPEPNIQDSVLLVDLVATWTPTLSTGTELNLRAGVENVFDTLPPFVRANFFPIDQGVYDIRGRYWFVSAGVQF